MLKSFLTFKVESILGAIFIIGVAGYFVGFLFVSMQNFDTDIALMDVDSSNIKYITDTERGLIDLWVANNGLSIPEGKGYRYLMSLYPDKPWLTSY